ncbi:Ankyrin-2, variant 2 [Schistosoma haematobium]|uniref:Ankyrin-2, variant 2 n=1 Tax=Schistosoma haematobium TaxID=6185 RepID=A0A922LN21_SCHHA|nr:Ankyrin-2, variant 2 [Schistosoma haematobium]KAH9590113.1 Ankyrin-2, variant 2 [Schistosoma haematobium]
MLEHPDFMREHPFTELDEDGVAPSPSISHRLSTSNKKLKSNEDDNYYSSDVTEQKSHTGLFNSAFDSTILAETENDDIWGQLEYMHSTLTKWMVACSEINPRRVFRPIWDSSLARCTCILLHFETRNQCRSVQMPSRYPFNY